MKIIKIMLFFTICAFLLSGCVSTMRTNTHKNIPVETAMIETTPVAADLKVSERKASGEVRGLLANEITLDMLTQEAVAKALGQDPPSLTGADLLLAPDYYIVQRGKEATVTVTGYPAWYINFRNAEEEETGLVGVVGLGPKPNLKKMYKMKASSGYYLEANLDIVEAGVAIGGGGGFAWSNGMFMGLELGYGNMSGGGFSIGGVYELPARVQLVYGGSVGFWYMEVEREGEGWMDWSWSYYDVFRGYVGPFVGLRWHGVGLSYRGLIGEGNGDYASQFRIGYHYSLKR
ncbi:MAG: hypothetical protein FWB85_09615 [Chitinispirillia bacterium]|nr:hypothetical protein [Chitinispirillia bacterium]MCL2242437.1 hypothetical protein [Chitinispirillia bacterium]